MTESAPPAGTRRSIWYMGAKGRIIPGFLERVLDEELERGDSLVDLMSGTGVVSHYFADRFRVVANDVQLYSTVIAKSLIEHHPATRDAFLESLDPDGDLKRSFQRNRASLERRYRPALEEEKRLLEAFASLELPAKASRAGTKKALGAWAREYRRFLGEPAGVYPLPSRATRGLYGGAASLLSEASVRRRRLDPAARPAFLVTAYYANVYYGLRQAIEIDSLRAAIADLDPEAPFADRKRTHYLSALLHAASVSTSGTSHFAQPRHLRKDSELVAMARRRTIDVVDLFAGYSREIAADVGRTAFREGNAAYGEDYRRFIGADGRFAFPGGADLVYLDPPYTSDHYSRFYHVLEVLARYDYPALERDSRGEVVRGRYPEIGKRFQSDFCRPSRVEDEFRSVARAAAASGAKLVVSYAWPTGLLLKRYAGNGGRRSPLSRFEDVFRESYRRVRTLRRPMMHSGQGDSNLSIEELLVVCGEPSVHGRGR